MSKSKIEWTDVVWNPLAGCTKVSPGCANCYAEAMAKRLRAMGQEKYQTVVDDQGRWNGKIWFGDDALLEKPLTWRKPRRIFVDSMTDLFHEAVKFEFIRRVFHTMMEARQHVFQVLTKRPERALEFFRWYDKTYWRKSWNNDRLFEQFAQHHPNIWMLASVEDQRRANERIPFAVQWPTSVRGLSMEPLLGPVELELRGSINWVIVGGESGPDARPMHPEWARAIRDQCQEAGIPFFFKQWGEWLPNNQVWPPNFEYKTGQLVKLWQPGKTGFHSRKIGKRAAGRLLDGREWNEYPGGA